MFLVLEVDDSECWPRILELKSSDFEVLNAGVPGYGLDQAMLYFDELGEAWKPDIVIIGFMSMQLPRHVIAFQSFANRRAVPCSKPRFVIENNQLLLRPNQLKSKEDYLELLREPSRILPSLGEFDYFYNIENARPVTGYCRKFVKLLSIAKDNYIEQKKDDRIYYNGHYNTNNEAFLLTQKIILVSLIK